MIEYTKADDKLKITKAVDLLKSPPVVINVKDFNADGVKAFREDFNHAEESDQEIIPIVIDSFGGQVYSLLAMVDIIQSSQKKVATISLGKAMSCGAVLLTCGTEGYRYAAPTSTILIHDASGFAIGKTEDIKVEAKEIERLNKLIFGIMEKNCGLKKDTLYDVIRKEKSGADWFLTPKEAKKFNIINNIKIPKLLTTISVKTELL